MDNHEKALETYKMLQKRKEEKEKQKDKDYISLKVERVRKANRKRYKEYYSRGKRFL